MVTAISVKLCIYPHTGNLKSDEFNITDTIGKILSWITLLLNYYRYCCKKDEETVQYIYNYRV